MENEYMKRGYLLPEGCKELSDVAKLKKPVSDVPLPKVLHKFTWDTAEVPYGKKSATLPPVTRQVFISPPTSVKKLAALLEQKPIQIICDLTQLGVWATIDSLLDFKIISRVARMHGFQAIKGA